MERDTRILAIFLAVLFLLAVFVGIPLLIHMSTDPHWCHGGPEVCRVP